MPESKPSSCAFEKLKLFHPSVSPLFKKIEHGDGPGTVADSMVLLKGSDIGSHCAFAQIPKMIKLENKIFCIMFDF